MSKYKDQTDDTPPSSSEGSPAAGAIPSKPSPKTGDLQTSTPILKEQSSLTTVSDKDLQHSEILRVVLSHLLTRGLVKRYKVLSEDGATIKEILLVFDPAIWTETIELKGVVKPFTTVTTPPAPGGESETK